MKDQAKDAAHEQVRTCITWKRIDFLNIASQITHAFRTWNATLPVVPNSLHQSAEVRPVHFIAVHRSRNPESFGHDAIVIKSSVLQLFDVADISLLIAVLLAAVLCFKQMLSAWRCA